MPNQQWTQRVAEALTHVAPPPVAAAILRTLAHHDCTYYNTDLEDIAHTLHPEPPTPGAPNP